MIDYHLIDDVEIENIVIEDYEDFQDAYIISAEYDGVAMSEEMLDELNTDDEFIYSSIINQLKRG